MGYIGPIPAQVPLTSSDIEDGIITAPKLATDAVETAKVKDVNVTAGKLAATQDLSTKTITLPATVAGLGTGINVTNQITGIVPAANLGTGTASSTTILYGDGTYKTEPTTDLQSLKADLTALALREATNEASAAFNLPNQFIETFTDDTNLGTQTDGDRTSGYWTTIIPANGIDANTVLMLQFNTAPGATIVDTSDNSGDITITKSGSGATDAAQAKFGSYSYHNEQSTADYIYTGNLSSGLTRAFPTTGDFTVDFWAYQSTCETSNRLFSIGNSGTPASGGQPVLAMAITTGSPPSLNFHGGYGTNNPPGETDMAENGVWHHWAVQRTGANSYAYFDGKIYWDDSGTGQDHLDGDSLMQGDDNVFLGARSVGSAEHFRGYIDEFRISNIARYAATAASGTQVFTPETAAYDAGAVNATGTLIQSANTVASAKTKVGGTMLYKDNAGTATLGTDLKIYFSCNNGGAWTEAASYNAITPVYSTGVKQVRLGETTCTSGTGIIYKAVWANQASGSKETQLHGIGINY